MSSPAQRSLAYLKKNGFIAAVVEKWNPYARVRQDLFGFIDIVAFDYFNGKIFGVQTTSTGNMNARIKKIISIPEAKYWLQAGATIFVHGWSKKGAAGRRKTYQIKVVEVKISDFKE